MKTDPLVSALDDFAKRYRLSPDERGALYALAVGGPEDERPGVTAGVVAKTGLPSVYCAAIRVLSDALVVATFDFEKRGSRASSPDEDE